MDQFRAPRPGVLPRTGRPKIGEIELPAGRSIVPDPAYASSADAPVKRAVLWVTDAPVHKPRKLWSPLSQTFASNGLWPLVLEGLRGAAERPWLSGELDPSASSRPEKHDAAKVLEESRAQRLDDESEADSDGDESDATFLLTPAQKHVAWPRAAEEVVAELSGQLGLVAVERPADAIAAIGWQGPVNQESDMGKYAAVLRSWEERFGAVVVGIGFDTLTLAVHSPPPTLKIALQVAAEHAAFCPDNIDQGFGSIEACAKAMVGHAAWRFWWD